MKSNLLLLGVCFLLIVSVASAQDIHMVVCLHITKDSVSSTCTKLFEGSPEDYVLDYPDYFTGKVYSLKNVLLYNFTFEKSVTAFDGHGGSYGVEEFDRDISFPQYRDVGRLEIWEGRNKKLDLDLSVYATCNEDMVCDSTESELTCPEDCMDKAAVVKEPVKGEMALTESVEKVQPVPTSKGRNNLILIAIAAGILILFFLWLILRRPGPDR